MGSVCLLNKTCTPLTTMNKTVRLASLFFCALMFAGVLRAQDVHAIAEREVVRRQNGIGKGEATLVQAKAAMDAKDFARAHDAYRAACDFLPDGTTTGGGHEEAVRGFCESGVKLAEQRIAAGKYGEAEEILREIMSDRYNPNCRPAEDLLKRLQAPGDINKTMGPKFIAKVEDVRRLLGEAEGYYQSGRYDLAMKKYDQILALDPYNVAARRGQERIDLTKTHYGEEAYNETRARQLWQVQKGWEEPVRDYGKAIGPITDAITKDVTGTARITNKLNSIIIPKIEFRDASIREAIDFIRQQAAANDPTTEGRRGVDIVLRLSPLGRPATEIVAPIDSSLPPPATAEGTAAARQRHLRRPSFSRQRPLQRMRALHSRSTKFRSAKRCVTSPARPD